MSRSKRSTIPLTLEQLRVHHLFDQKKDQSQPGKTICPNMPPLPSRHFSLPDPRIYHETVREIVSPLWFTTDIQLPFRANPSFCFGSLQPSFNAPSRSFCCADTQWRRTFRGLWSRCAWGIECPQSQDIFHCSVVDAFFYTLHVTSASTLSLSLSLPRQPHAFSR